MKPAMIHLSWVAALVIIALFVKANEKDTDSTRDLEELKAINAKFINNFVTNDTISHGKIIHSSFVLITPRGGKVRRKEYLAEWAHGFDVKKYYYWDYRDESISIYGPFALVRSVTKYTKLVDGKEVSMMTRYTDTYIKENGKWQCVQAQLTSVTPENFPADDTIVKKYLNGIIQSSFKDADPKDAALGLYSI